MNATRAAWERLKAGTLIVKPINVSPFVAVYTTIGPGGVALRKPRKLRVAENSKQYLIFNLRFNGKRFSCLLHRITWMAHHNELIKGDDEIDHKNQNKHDCRPENLERVSPYRNLLLRNHRNGYAGTSTAHMTEEEREEYFDKVYGAF